MRDGSLAALRQKIAAHGQTPAPSGAGPNGDGGPDGGGAAILRGWRLALGRAARDEAGLALDVTALDMGRHALAEVMDMPPERALLMVLDEPGAVGLGMVALSGPLVSALVEKMTTGRVSAQPPAPRRATRTDALLLSSLVDSALGAFEAALGGGGGDFSGDAAPWARGYRYASMLDDSRPMALMFDDVPYGVLRAEVAVDRGPRTGQVILALPAGPVDAAQPRLPAEAAPRPADDPAAFRAALGAQVAGAELRLDAVLARLSLPIARLMALRVGEELALPQATIDRLRIEAGGLTVAQARLGQVRGLRAARLQTPTPASQPTITTAQAFDHDAGYATAAE